MSAKIQGSSSGNIAEVDSNNNLKANLPTTISQAGIMVNASQPDTGAITGTRYVRPVDSSSEGRMKVGMDTIVMSEVFSGSAINTAIFNTPNATATASQGSGYLTLNNGGSTTSTQGISLRTYRTFPIYDKFTTSFEFLLSLNALAASVNNVTAEWGASLAGTSPGTASTDGAIFRYTSSGLTCLIVNNGTELSETLISAANLSTLGVVLTNTNKFTIIFEEDVVSFWVAPPGKNQMSLCLEIARPTTGTTPNQSMELPIFARVYNTGTNSGTAQKINFSLIAVVMGDMDNNKPYHHIMAGSQNFCQTIFSGQTPGRTASWNTWTALPAQMTSVSVTDIGTAGTSGLGGIQRMGNGSSTLALTADSAYIVFKYQVPALTVTNPIVPSKSLYITGFRLDVSNRGAAGPSTVSTLTIGLNIGHFQANPATADSATTPNKQARIDTLGMVGITASVATGVYLGAVGYIPFQTPIVIQPGEYITVFASPSVSYTIVANQELIFSCHFDGYWE